MSPNWGKDVVSNSAEEARSELLWMLSWYYKCADNKNFDINNLNERGGEIIRFVSDNRSILIPGATLIIHIASHLNLRWFNIALYNYRQKAWNLYTDILRILLPENDNSWVDWVLLNVTSAVDWIQQQAETINKVLELEQTNLWKPTCPDIEINPEEASETIPQAWENNWNWYYNWEWAILEAKALGKKIPTKEEWDKIREPYWNDWKKMIIELNLPMLGFRSRNNGLYYYQGSNGYYRSSSLSTTVAFYSLFISANVRPTDLNTRAGGFAVRCLKS